MTTRIILLVLLLSLLGFFCVKTYKSFNKSFFNKISRINLIITNSKNFNAVFSAEENNSFLFTLVPTEKIVLARGFGEYEIGKIYSLGELDKKGGELLSQSVQEFWSIPIFGYVESESINEKKILESKRGEIRKLIKNCIFGKCKTNLKNLDLLVLYFKLLKTNDNNILSKKIGLNEKINLLKDKKIRNEALAIEVLNSTDHTGLAEKAKNLLENIGGRVVRLSEAESHLNNCKIIVKPNLIVTYTFGFLREIYGCDIEKSNEGAGNRADITLILGEGYWEKLSEKW